MVDPDQMYLVTVSNLPKPNMGHDMYNISKVIAVPGEIDSLSQFKKTRLANSGITVRKKQEHFNDKRCLSAYEMCFMDGWMDVLH